MQQNMSTKQLTRLVITAAIGIMSEYWLITRALRYIETKVIGESKWETVHIDDNGIGLLVGANERKKNKWLIK